MSDAVVGGSDGGSPAGRLGAGLVDAGTIDAVTIDAVTIGAGLDAGVDAGASLHPAGATIAATATRPVRTVTSDRLRPTTTRDPTHRRPSVISLTKVRDMTDGVAEQLRRFNRSFTQRIGVLDDSFLGAGRPLGQARLLFEIGSGHTSVLELRRRLGLDSGYLSRLVGELADDGLVEVEPDPDDGRRRIVTLTDTGRRAWSDLDERSDELAVRLIEPLTERQRIELATALTTADRLLRAAAVTFETVDPASDEAVGAMTAYFGELDERFVGGFDPGDTLTADAASMRPPAGSFVVARSDDEVVACGGVVRHDETTGEIKRMWVHADWRGVGLGRRTLAALEREVARLGYGTVVLDTNAVLTEAITMYGRAGYVPTDRYNDNPYAQRWFTKPIG